MCASWCVGSASECDEEEWRAPCGPQWPGVALLLLLPLPRAPSLQGLPGCLPWGMILTFLNDFFSQDKGLSVVVRGSG